MNIPGRLTPYAAGTAQFAAAKIAKQRMLALQSPVAIGSELEQERSRQRIESIRGVLRSGKPLTPEELGLLRTHSLELYSIAKQAEEERRVHASALKRSHSRSEATSMHQQQVILMAAHARSSKDPERTAIVLGAVQDAYSQFRQSADYSRLK